MSKEERARLSGMSYALRIAKEKGIDSLEADLKRRGAHNIPVGLDNRVLEDFMTRIRANTIDTVLVMSCIVLRDEFDYGAKRINRFIERFKFKTECMMEDLIAWPELQETLKEELGIELKIRWSDL